MDAVLSPNAGRVRPLRAELVEGEQAKVTFGAADEATLAELVSRGVLLGDGRTADRLFIGTIELSSSRVDDWGTWFDQSSLGNFAADVSEGTGRPLMLQHNMRAFGIGRLYAGLMEALPPGDPTISAQKASTIPLARSWDEPAFRLIERFVIVRGLLLMTEPMVPSDVVIDNILASNVREASLGGTIDPITAAGGDLICDICTQSLIRSNGLCVHMPRVVYELEGGPVVCTAKYTGARQREGSFVGKGSTPGAGFLVDRASRLLAQRHLAVDAAQNLEDVYRAHIGGVPRTTYSAGTEVRPGGQPSREIETPGGEGGGQVPQENVQEGSIEVRRAAAEKFLKDLDSDGGRRLVAGLDSFGRSTDPWEATAKVLADELAAVDRAQANAEKRLDAFKLRMIRRWEPDNETDDPATFDEVMSRREGLIAFAEAARGALVDDYKAAYVLRHGAKVDIERVMARTAGWSPEDFVEETARLRGDSEVVSPGRVSRPQKPVGRIGTEAPESAGDDEPEFVPKALNFSRVR